MNKYNFKFRKEPNVIKYFRLSEAKETERHIRIVEIIKELKLGGFKIGNLFASFWFGITLFAMQSYFLRQNLQRSTQFISD
jgi:hypothetical protein